MTKEKPDEEKSLAVQTDYPVTEVIAPDAVMDAAIKASKKLKEVIDRKPRKVMINGEAYLEYEDWGLLGKFYGVSVRTQEAKPVEVNGVKGAHARAEVILVKNGIVVGGADAYCLQDEPNWKTKPFFQLASMAQTRAGAKALRNVLSWVAVLAGYRPTPAEEMEGVIITPKNGISAPKTATSAPVSKPKGPLTEMYDKEMEREPGQDDIEVKAKYLITDKQRKMIYARAKSKNIPDEVMKDYLNNKFGISSSIEIQKEWMDAVLQFIQDYVA